MYNTASTKTLKNCLPIFINIQWNKLSGRQKNYIRKILSCAGAILLGIYIGKYASRIPSKGFALAPIAFSIIGIMIILYKSLLENLFYAMIFIILVAPSIVVIPNINFPLNLFISLDFLFPIFLMTSLFLTNKDIFKINKSLILFLIFFLLALLDFRRTIDLNFSIVMFYKLATCLMYFLVAFFYVNRKNVYNILKIFIIASVFNGVLGILQLFGGNTFFLRTGSEKTIYLEESGEYLRRIVGVYGDTIHFGTFLAISIPLLFNYYLYKKNYASNIRYLYLLLIFTLLFLSFFSLRSTLAALLGVTVFYYLFQGKISIKIIAGLFSIGIFSLIIIYAFGLLAFFTRLDQSTWIKISLLLGGIEMFLTNPLLGVGFGNSMFLLEKHNERIIELVRYTLGLFGSERSYDLISMPLHNFVITLLAENGIIGTTLFIVALVLIYRQLKIVFNRLEAVGDSNRYLVLGLTTGITALLIGSLFHNTVYTYFFWILLGIAAKSGELFTTGKVKQCV